MQEPYYSIVRQWQASGTLAHDDLIVLKAEYLRQIGAAPDCRTCANVVSDIRQHFFYQFKQLHKVANQLAKYLLPLGHIMLPGDNVAYVSQPPFNASRIELTDEIGDQITAQYPSLLGQLIAINPHYTVVATDTGDAADKDAQIAELIAERDQLKQERTTLKGQLTRATNALAELKIASVTTSADTKPADLPGQETTSFIEPPTE